MKQINISIEEFDLERINAIASVAQVSDGEIIRRCIKQTLKDGIRDTSSSHRQRAERRQGMKVK